MTKRFPNARSISKKRSTAPPLWGGDDRLNSELAKELKGLVTDQRVSLFKLCRLASEIRNRHLTQNGKSYDAEFRAWWTTESLDRVFGQMSNFTKYAEAGDLIVWVETNTTFDRDRLPSSRNALYELSLAKKKGADLGLELRPEVDRVSSPPESSIGEDVLIENTDETIVGQDKSSTTWINSFTTARDIKARYQPRSVQSRSKPSVSEHPPLAELHVDPDFFNLDNRGNYKGAITPEQLLAIKSQIETVLANSPVKIVWRLEEVEAAKEKLQQEAQQKFEKVERAYNVKRDSWMKKVQKRVDRKIRKKIRTGFNKKCEPARTLAKVWKVKFRNRCERNTFIANRGGLYPDDITTDDWRANYRTACDEDPDYMIPDWYREAMNEMPEPEIPDVLRDMQLTDAERAEQEKAANEAREWLKKLKRRQEFDPNKFRHLKVGKETASKLSRRNCVEEDDKDSVDVDPSTSTSAVAQC